LENSLLSGGAERFPLVQSVKVALLLSAVNFLLTFAFALNDSFFSVLFGDITGRGLFLGFAFIFYSLSKLVCCPFAGKLLNRYGESSILTFALGVCLFASFLLGTADNVYVLFIARAAQGAGCVLLRPVMYAMIGKNTRGGSVGRVSGFVEMSFYAALAAGPVTGGYVMEQYGAGQVKNIVMFCTFCAFLLSLFTGRVENNKDISGQSAEPDVPLRTSFVFKGLLVYIFFKAWAISTLTVYFPVMMLDKGYDVRVIGLMLSTVSFVTALFFIVTGYLADRLNRRKIIILCGLLSAVTMMVLPFAGSRTDVLVLLVFSGLFSGLSQPAGTSLLIEHALGGDKGSVLSLFNMVMTFGFICAPFVNSVTGSLFGIKTVFISAGILSLLSVVYFCCISFNMSFVFSFKHR